MKIQKEQFRKWAARHIGTEPGLEILIEYLAEFMYATASCPEDKPPPDFKDVCPDWGNFEPELRHAFRLHDLKKTNFPEGPGPDKIKANPFHISPKL